MLSEENLFEINPELEKAFLEKKDFLRNLLYQKFNIDCNNYDPLIAEYFIIMQLSTKLQQYHTAIAENQKNYQDSVTDLDENLESYKKNFDSLFNEKIELEKKEIEQLLVANNAKITALIENNKNEYKTLLEDTYNKFKRKKTNLIFFATLSLIANLTIAIALVVKLL